MPTTRETAFINASESGDISLVKDCLKDDDNNKVNIDVKDINGMTALHQAATKDHIEIVKILVAKRAKINIKNADGNTPLHCAVLGNHKDVVQLLLENGANYKIRNNDKKTLNINTVEHFTVHEDHNVVRDFGYSNFFFIKSGNKDFEKPNKNSRERGVDSYYKDYNSIEFDVQKGLTPLELAQQEKKWEIVELISDFISLQNYSIIQTANKISRIEVSTNKISQLEKEMHDLKQIVISQQNNIPQPAPKLPFYDKFLPTFEQKTAITAAIFLMGLMLAIDGKEIIDDEYKFVGKSLMSLCCIALVVFLTRQIISAKKEVVRTKGELAAIMAAARIRAGLLSDALTETIINGADLLKAFKKATYETKDVLVALGKTTDKAIVQLKDEFTGSLVQLRGDATKVASAIQDGIDKGRFQPQAKVNAVVNVDADFDIRANKMFSIF